MVAEEQDIVYRDAAGRGPPAAQPSGELIPVTAGESRLTRAADPVLLFRFSALTYNAHRIHYDRGYAQDVEGYPGLVVHGPLQVLMMAETARALARPEQDFVRQRFAYRLVAPLFDG